MKVLVGKSQKDAVFSTKSENLVNHHLIRAMMIVTMILNLQVVVEGDSALRKLASNGKRKIEEE